MPKSNTKKETRKVRTQKNKKVSTKTTTEPPATNDRQTEHPYTESYMSSSSSYASNMLFDGNKMTIDTQINGQPVEHKEYTLRDIRKNNPLGAELIKQYLKNKVPRTLKRPPVNTQIYIRPVLSSFSDLGLNNNNHIDHDHDDQDQKDAIYKILPTDENIRLRISDIDSDSNNSHLINELPMNNANPKPKPKHTQKNKSVKKNKNKNKNE